MLPVIHPGRVNILIADDDEFVAKGMQITLQSYPQANWEVEIEYELVQNIYHKLQSNSFAVLILDLDWFGDQRSSLKAIRKLKNSLPNLRVVAISAFPKLVNQASKIGVEIARSKGFTGQELIRLIETVLNSPPIQHNSLDDLVNPEKTLQELQRRLTLLKVKRAQMGFDTPPHVIMEIEDIEKNLHSLEKTINKEKGKD